MKKVIENGMVAVLYSPCFGAGWYTWNDSYPECIFSPEIVNLVREGRHNEITNELCQELFEADHFCAGGADDLVIKWLPVGTAFEIIEYDGSESLRIIEEIDYIVA